MIIEIIISMLIPIIMFWEFYYWQLFDGEKAKQELDSNEVPAEEVTEVPVDFSIDIPVRRYLATEQHISDDRVRLRLNYDTCESEVIWLSEYLQLQKYKYKEINIFDYTPTNQGIVYVIILDFSIDDFKNMAYYILHNEIQLESVTEQIIKLLLEINRNKTYF